MSNEQAGFAHCSSLRLTAKKGCMSKGNAIEVMAVVLEPLPNAMFRLNWKTSIRCCTVPERCARISSAFCPEIKSQ